MTIREQFALEILKALIANKQITNIDWGVYVTHSVKAADKLVDKLLESPTPTAKESGHKYIDDLGVSKRLNTILTAQKLYTIEDVYKALEIGGMQTFISYHGCGKKSLEELVEVLDEHGIILAANCCYKKAD